MLCKICKAAILIADDELGPTSDIGKVPRQVRTHNDLTELELSAWSGCLICRKILESITGYQTPSKTENTFLNVNTTHDFRLTVSLRPYGMRRVLVEGLYGDIHLNVRFRMRKVWSNGKYDVTSQPNLHLSSTSETSNLWRKWFHECLESHSFCHSSTNQTPKFVPKRLVEIITDGKGLVEKWQLVLGDRIGEATYLTLSHCWGSSNHISLTKQNIDDLMTPSLCSVLPATYRDALVVAAALGTRHIWIDSLCIIQNDKDDWKSQSSVMGYIYKHSACNIAALKAADSSDGLFCPKEAPTILTLQGEEYQFEDDSKYRYAFEKEDIEDAPLNSRAWVVQERYLTPRQLGFGKSQIYWACRWTCASEESPDSNESPYEQRVGQIWNLSPVDASRKKKIEALLRDPGYMEKIDQAEHWSHLDYLENLEPRVTWPTLVTAYSKCHLTYLTDKSIALAGLAAEFRETAKDTYLAGLWRHDLEYQLYWSVCDTSRSHQTIRTVQPYVAPSWSWLNMDAPVVYDPEFRAKWRDTKCVEILEVSVQSEDPNALHSFTSSTLRLRGIVLRGRLTDCAEKNLGLAGPDRGSYVDPNAFKMKNFLSHPGQDAVEEVAIQIDWDEYQLSIAEDPQRYSRLQQERSSELLILPFRFRTVSFAHGLVLWPLEITKGETICVRLGVFRFMKEGFPMFIRETLGLPEYCFGNDQIDLKDARLSGLVQEVRIQ